MPERKPGFDKPPAHLPSLHSWYAAHRRPLPWRATRDPYRILVSEFLLQQTQVKQAIPYYKRFLARFPTVRSLASASQHDVLKLWEGAGYYARARNLHKTAKIIVETYGGKIPPDYATLISMPGIGPYLAAAVSSIAFGEQRAVLDGNVIRVIARVNAVQQAVDTPAAKKKLQKMADDWLSKSKVSPSAHNQAMMELGALVCTPRAPGCAHCPLQKDCAAFSHGAQEEFPVKNARPRRPVIAVATVLLVHKGKVLIAQRWGDDFLGGLWEFPGGKQEAGEALSRTVAREFLEEVGLRVRPVREVMAVRAEYTHKSVDMAVFLCRLEKQEKPSAPRAIDCQDVRWEKVSNLRRYAFPKANHAMIDWLEKNFGA
ncbi:MAG: A/G-specific adenine glycosylase [Candidatus Micrarchaeota archaeon]|nr:A/G-specific adenine glycosylase [Candidatus Micrarchaeota archaeon]